MKKILFYGDSITDCGRNRDDIGCLGKGYPMVIASKLVDKYPMEYSFVNRGISGDRIVDLYQRQKKDLINHNPDYVSILIGINDVWHEADSKNGVSAKRFEDVYTMLIEDIKEALPNVKIIIMEPFYLLGSATIRDNDVARYEFFKTETSLRATAARRVAEKFGLPFIELQNVLEKAAENTSNEYVLYDGVHPGIYGRTVIANEWIKCFEATK